MVNVSFPGRGCSKGGARLQGRGRNISLLPLSWVLKLDLSKSKRCRSEGSCTRCYPVQFIYGLSSFSCEEPTAAEPVKMSCAEERLRN